MTDRAEVTGQDSQKSLEQASKRAKARAGMARWDLNLAVFLFAILIIVIILLFQGIGVEIVAPVAAIGLALVWLAGWRRGRQLYIIYYNEEMLKLERSMDKTVEEVIEETIEEKVQKALRDRM